MTKKIVYKVLCDEYMKITRIFFEIKETGEQIEGTHQIEKWVNTLFKENEQLKSENEVIRRLITNISLQRDEFHREARENANRVGKLKKENEKLKQLLLQFYTEDEIDSEMI